MAEETPNPFAASESSPEELELVAWEPISPWGVAAFSGVSTKRVFVMLAITAALVAGAAVWFVKTAWCPVIRQAIQQLRDTGYIHHGELILPDLPSPVLAQSRFLALIYAPDGQGQDGLEADVKVEFDRNQVRFRSLFGYVPMFYPLGYVIQFNRPALEPWWKAWEPMILAVGGAALGLGLLLLWTLLACLYAAVPWTVAFLGDRDLGLAGSWRLSLTAQIPGALLLIAALIAYGTETIDLTLLLTFVLVHFVLGWIYLGVSPLFLPRLRPRRRKPKADDNPFAPPDEESEEDEEEEN